MRKQADKRTAQRAAEIAYYNRKKIARRAFEDARQFCEFQQELRRLFSAVELINAAGVVEQAVLVVREHDLIRGAERLRLACTEVVAARQQCRATSINKWPALYDAARGEEVLAVVRGEASPADPALRPAAAAAPADLAPSPAKMAGATECALHAECAACASAGARGCVGACAWLRKWVAAHATRNTCDYALEAECDFVRAFGPRGTAARARASAMARDERAKWGEQWERAVEKVTAAAQQQPLSSVGAAASEEQAVAALREIFDKQLPGTGGGETLPMSIAEADPLWDDASGSEEEKALTGPGLTASVSAGLPCSVGTCRLTFSSVPFLCRHWAQKHPHGVSAAQLQSVGAQQCTGCGTPYVGRHYCWQKKRSHIVDEDGNGFDSEREDGDFCDEQQLATGDDKDFVCEKCLRSFKKLWLLIEHWRHYHPKTVPDEQVEKVGAYKCPWCLQPFTTKAGHRICGAQQRAAQVAGQPAEPPRKRVKCGLSAGAAFGDAGGKVVKCGIAGCGHRFGSRSLLCNHWRQCHRREGVPDALIAQIGAVRCTRCNEPFLDMSLHRGCKGSHKQMSTKPNAEPPPFAAAQPESTEEPKESPPAAATNPPKPCAEQVAVPTEVPPPPPDKCSGDGGWLQLASLL
eukprot:TRINITY_DN1976_c0_g1_i1.p1 TRINITY_DN1976_c0_g1~~TRINITY_DN1976_c0_g1_i1.p1  ORF type:complete len:636 (+),score=119.21 TRINITY_DN1976_c0_g1_i1:3-1910(+)